MIDTTTRLRGFQLALVASAAVALSACSKTNTDSTQPTAAVSAPAQVAVAPVQAPAVVAQNNGTYEQGRRDQARRDARRAGDERPLPPRLDRDADMPPPGSVEEQQRWRHDRQEAAASCAECGVIEAVDAVKVQGQTNGVGAVAGGVGGALVGNRIAGGNNRTLGGIVGAVGGGLLGNAIEKHERTETVYDVRVRMNDGSLRTVRQSTSRAVGEKVRVEADGLHDRA